VRRENGGMEDVAMEEGRQSFIVFERMSQVGMQRIQLWSKSAAEPVAKNWLGYGILGLVAELENVAVQIQLMVDIRTSQLMQPVRVFLSGNLLIPSGKFRKQGVPNSCIGMKISGCLFWW